MDDAVRRFRNGEARGAIFRDLILADAKLDMPGRELILLDIGCGRGIENNHELQKSLAAISAQYIGVEPDANIPIGDWITLSYQCRFEDAPLEPNSIDIAFAFMVLEHLTEPQVFWNTLYAVLRPNGIFWGWTVDARHWFVLASLLTERLGFKNFYLNHLHGERGKDRYENYSAHYQSNHPAQIKQLARQFRDVQIFSVSKVGQIDFYLPQQVRWLAGILDEVAIRLRLPGANLVVRAEK